MFLVLLYNLLCKTFKDHSSAFAASSLSERNPLLQERCFPIASAKVGHFCIPCKRSPKKNARKFHLRPFCHFIALQNRQQSPFVRLSPTPTFFAPQSPFFPLFPVLSPFSGDFSRARSRFLPCEVHFFLVLPRFGPTSGDFSRNFSRFSLRSPLFAQREGFFISCFPHSSLPPSPSSPDLLPFRFTIIPPSSLPPPLYFSFLPTFPSSSPINARSCAPSRNTRVRVRSHTPTRQEVFVYCLHRFTTPRNLLCTNALWVKENKKKPSQKYTTASQSTH